MEEAWKAFQACLGSQPPETVAFVLGTIFCFLMSAFFSKMANSSIKHALSDARNEIRIREQEVAKLKAEGIKKDERINELHAMLDEL